MLTNVGVSRPAVARAKTPFRGARDPVPKMRPPRARDGALSPCPNASCGWDAGKTNGRSVLCRPEQHPHLLVTRPQRHVGGRRSTSTAAGTRSPSRSCSSRSTRSSSSTRPTAGSFTPARLAATASRSMEALRAIEEWRAERRPGGSRFESTRSRPEATDDTGRHQRLRAHRPQLPPRLARQERRLRDRRRQRHRRRRDDGAPASVRLDPRPPARRR